MNGVGRNDSGDINSSKQLNSALSAVICLLLTDCPIRQLDWRWSESENDWNEFTE